MLPKDKDYLLFPSTSCVHWALQEEGHEGQLPLRMTGVAFLGLWCLGMPSRGCPPQRWVLISPSVLTAAGAWKNMAPGLHLYQNSTLPSLLSGCPPLSSHQQGIFLITGDRGASDYTLVVDTDRSHPLALSPIHLCGALFI